MRPVGATLRGMARRGGELVRDGEVGFWIVAAVVVAGLLLVLFLTPAPFWH